MKTVVYIVNKWQGISETTRVFSTIEAARQDCLGGRTYIERAVLEKPVCPQCGK